MAKWVDMMLKKERGMIKWMPFNSVVPSNDVIKSILIEKSKIKMPVLCEEQKNKIEHDLMLKYYANEKISISYYYQGKILTINERIKKIDSVFHKIYFENHTLLFDQIIKING